MFTCERKPNGDSHIGLDRSHIYIIITMTFSRQIVFTRVCTHTFRQFSPHRYAFCSRASNLNPFSVDFRMPKESRRIGVYKNSVVLLLILLLSIIWCIDLMICDRRRTDFGDNIGVRFSIPDIITRFAIKSIRVTLKWSWVLSRTSFDLFIQIAILAVIIRHFNVTLCIVIHSSFIILYEYIQFRQRNLIR